MFKNVIKTNWNKLNRLRRRERHHCLKHLRRFHKEEDILLSGSKMGRDRFEKLKRRRLGEIRYRGWGRREPPTAQYNSVSGTYSGQTVESSAVYMRRFAAA